MVRKIAEIKDMLKQADFAQKREILHQLEQDGRKGVQDLAARTWRRIEAYEAEKQRLKVMHIFEEKYAQYTCICGIDEAGRGPLAGPVAAGAVVLPADAEILYLNDSKKLSEKKREILYDEILEKAVTAAVGIVSPERIDEINILNATYEAMREAIHKLDRIPDLLLNDAVTIPSVPMKQVGIIKGDAKSVSIAAASILAKVTRDRMMCAYHELYPQYGFDRNKGYGSREHIEAIQTYGPCPIHRRSFLKNFKWEERNT